MADETILTAPEQLSAQSQVHQTSANIHAETSGQVQSGLGSLSAAWIGGGFDECGQFMQQFAAHLTSFSNFHNQLGSHLEIARANYEQVETTNAQGFQSR